MKKFISLLLAVAISLSVISVAAAEREALEPTDVQNTDVDYIVSDVYEGGRRQSDGEVYYVPGENKISSKVKFFMDLGVIDHYHPDNALQRNVLKKFFEVVYNYPELYDNYFQGEGNEKNTLTFDEALMVFMNITGYDIIAEEEGGTKEIYMRNAQRSGLLDGVDIEIARKKLTAETFITMAYNAVSVGLVKATISTSNTSYYKSDDNMIDDLLKLKKIEGVVKANSYGAINGNEGVDEEHLKIEDVVYSVAMNENVDDYLGYYVVAYVDKDNNIRSISVDEHRNSIVDFDNNSDIKESNNLETLVYYEENRKKTLKINKYADRVYNHIPYTGFETDFYLINNGTMRLIDNTGDKVYDVIIKKEYNSFIPESKGEFTGVIIDENGDRYNIKDLLDGKYRGIVDLDGDPQSMDLISTTTPISVLTQKNTNIVTEIIILDKNTFEGEFKTEKKINDKNVYIIGDKEFKLADVYKKANQNKFPFALGSNVLVYLDHMNRIIKAETTTIDYKYAWLVAIGTDDSAFSQDVLLKLFTEDNVMRVYNTTEKIKYNDKSISAVDLLTREEFMKYGETVEQLVKYKVNGDGEIIGIRTADTTSNVGLGKTKEKGSDSFQLNLNYYDLYLKTSNWNKYALWYCSGAGINSLGGKYFISADKTKIFNIPDKTTRESLRANGEDPERNFRVTYSLGNEYRYIFNLYDVDDEYTVGAAVSIGSGTTVDDYINAGWGSYMVLEAYNTWDPVSEMILDAVNIESLGSDWQPSVFEGHPYDAGDEKPSWGGAVQSSAHANLFRYALGSMYPYDPKNPETHPYAAEYYKINRLSQLRPGSIIKYTTIDGYFKQFSLEFMLLPDKNWDDQMFEYIYTETSYYSSYMTQNEDGTYTLNEESAYNLNKMDGVTRHTFYGKDLSAFGRVVNKFDNGFVFNAHFNADGTPDVEWNRRISASPNTHVKIVYMDRGIIERGTASEIQAGDYVYLNMVRGAMSGIVVYRP